MNYTLTDKDYKYISERVYDYSKINLTEKKRSLIVARLTKRMKKIGIDSISDYVKLLKNNDPQNKEFLTMIDSLSTNYSHFFRESHHFEFLTDLLSKYNNEINIWSAASSSGQEVYSILLTIKEFERLKKKRIKYNLYASDISRKVLMKASSGIYDYDETSKIDNALLKRYFLKGTGENINKIKVKNRYVKEVHFFRQNLNDKEFKVPKMDIIFLRNMIIYLDKKSKTELIEKLYHHLKPNGYLILGHSESLTGLSTKFKYVNKSIYQKEKA